MTPTSFIKHLGDRFNLQYQRCTIPTAGSGGFIFDQNTAAPSLAGCDQHVVWCRPDAPQEVKDAIVAEYGKPTSIQSSVISWSIYGNRN